MIEDLCEVKDCYIAFGLKIVSDILIPELIPSEGIPDVRIVNGKVPVKIDSIIEETEDYQISKTEFLFKINGVGSYHIKNGSEIIVESDKGADVNLIKVYLMGTAIGTLLLQRGMLPIHGSTVMINGSCVIFTGMCGAGKSTICSAFRKKGYEFLSDDVSVIALNEEGFPIVYPAFPQQKLCSDAAKKMGYNSESLSKLSKIEQKYLINSDKNYKREPIPLAAVFEIIVKPECAVEIIKIAGIKKLIKFMRDIYYFDILIRFGIKPAYFNQCLNIAKNIDYFDLTRPAGKFTVDQQIRLVQGVFEDYTKRYVI